LAVRQVLETSSVDLHPMVLATFGDGSLGHGEVRICERASKHGNDAWRILVPVSDGRRAGRAEEVARSLAAVADMLEIPMLAFQGHRGSRNLA